MQRGKWFAGARLARVPHPVEAASVVADAAAYWASQGVEPFEPATALAFLGWEIRYRCLAAAECRHQAMLVPLLTGGFVVMVDRALVDEGARRDPVALARALTHELAHSFFYAAGAPPERLVPLEPGEEAFCDAFASEMLQRHDGAA